MTDGSGKWYEALEDNLIERHTPCERKNLHLEKHSNNLSESRPDPPVENEKPPQSRPDLPAENGGLESRSAVSDTAAEIVPHLKEMFTLLAHGNKLKEKEIGLHETSIQLEKEALTEKKKTDAKIDKVADTTEESLDLLRQLSKYTYVILTLCCTP